jgi:hypothetical protein
MQKAVVGLVRWGVILGLLIALPAFAMHHGKWGEIAALLLDESGSSAIAEGHLGDLSFTGSQQSLDGTSKTLKPLGPEDPADQTVAPKVPAQTTDPVSQSRPQPHQAEHARKLRVPVYRPLGDGEDQTIRRIPSFRVSIGRTIPADRVRLDEMERHLLEMGAQRCRWQCDADSAEYHLDCEFPPTDARGTPQRLQARATDPAAAMRQVLAEAQRRPSTLQR